jgi:hypothetical protein
MNSLEFKRKTLGHTLRGGYDGEGTGIVPDAYGGGGTYSDASGTVTTGPMGASWSSGGGWDSAKASQYSSVGGMAPGPLGFVGRGLGYLAGGLSGYIPSGSVDYNSAGTSSGGNMFSGGGGPGDSLSSIFNIASGINAMGNQSGGAQLLADPFSPYRSGLAASYNQALTQGNQTDITKMPGYSQYQSGVMDPAMEAVKRSMAARGMNQSGNELLALQETGQKGYYGFMTDYLNRLAQGSGAVNNPAPAAGMGIDQQNLNQRATMQGIGAIGQGLAGLSGYFTGGGSGGGYSAAGYDVGGSGALNTSAYGSGLPAWQLAQQDIYG